MNPVNIFLVGTLATAAWFAFSKKKSAGLLNYYLTGLSVAFDGVTPLLKFQLVVQNVSNEYYQVNSVVADVYADGTNIGNLSSFTTVKIPPASAAAVPVVVRLRLLAIVDDLVSLIQQKSGIPKKLEIKGYINASGFVAPLEITQIISF